MTGAVAFVRPSLPLVSELNLYYSLGLTTSPCDPPTDSQIQELEKASVEYVEASTKLRETMRLLADDVRNSIPTADSAKEDISKDLENALSQCPPLPTAYLENPSRYVEAATLSLKCTSPKLANLATKSNRPLNPVRPKVLR